MIAPRSLTFIPIPSLLFAELMRLLGIDKLRKTAYKASTNGMVERFHRTLNSMLGRPKAVAETQRNWDKIVPQVLAAYRATPHDATGFSPNRLFFERELNMPVDFVWGAPEVTSKISQTLNEYVEKVREDIELAYELARKHLQKAAERRKTSYDMKVKKAEFNAGDWVCYYYPRKYRVVRQNGRSCTPGHSW